MIEYLKRWLSQIRVSLVQDPLPYEPQINVIHVSQEEYVSIRQEAMLCRLTLENETLKREIRQLERDFSVRVGLEVRLQTSALQRENAGLRAEVERLKHE